MNSVAPWVECRCLDAERMDRYKFHATKRPKLGEKSRLSDWDFSSIVNTGTFRLFSVSTLETSETFVPIKTLGLLLLLTLLWKSFTFPPMR